MPPIGDNKDIESIKKNVDKLINENKIVIFSKTTCPWCVKVKELIESKITKDYTVFVLDTHDDGVEIKDYLLEKTGQKTVPNVFLNGNHVGGYNEVAKAINDNNFNYESSSHKGVTQPSKGESIESFVTNLVKQNKIVIFSKTTCPFCLKVKELFKSLNESFVTIELDSLEQGSELRDYLFEKTGQKTVPNVYVNATHLGGSDSTQNAHNDGTLAKLLSEKNKIQEDVVKYDYDLVVIGGGSGGLSCSKTAADLGAKVAVLDFVKPTPVGTTWGLGGTCVNVGCIPKKLMHQASLLGEGLHDSKEFGWQTPESIAHDWETMKNNIVNYVKSLNFGYKVQLRDRNVEYINAYGQFRDNHRLFLTYKNGKTKEITANKIVIATGGRPKYPESVVNAEKYTITSDDLFSLPYNPGKTLCVGASYVSLECAGFLRGIGNDVTVMVRSILLRGFDQQMANIIGKFMEENAGVRFIRESVPVEIVQVRAPSGNQAGEHIVKYKNGAGEIIEETFNTVILAVGRDPCTSDICLNQTDVKLNPKNKKIITNFEQTNVDNIYGIGDVVDETTAGGRALELTPIAIKAGELLAKRLFGVSDVKMDYHSVATTVFTPIEYGAIGYSEEEAIEKFGDDNIEVYHANFWPLEWTVAHRPNDVCYVKLICNLADSERVVGLHVAGPNAGEITQGYAVAMKMRATKADFDMTVGIHPTCSEQFTTLKKTKRSGESVEASGC